MNCELAEGEVGSGIEIKECYLSPSKAGITGCGDHGGIVGAKLGSWPEHFDLITARPSRQMLPERLVASHPARKEDPRGPDALGGFDRIAREDIHDCLLETGRDIRH